jgi:hypothetical protein
MHQQEGSARNNWPEPNRGILSEHSLRQLGSQVFELAVVYAQGASKPTATQLFIRVCLPPDALPLSGLPGFTNLPAWRNCAVL